jgi:hypothetical protein
VKGAIRSIRSIREKSSARAWVLGKINREPRKIREPGFGFAYFAWFAIITIPFART